jgi:hypothetical protein
MIGDVYLVGIARKMIQNVFGSAKGLLGVDDQ